MDFHQLLTECVKRSASDLHLKSGSRPIVRVHGHLETQDDLPAVTRDFMRKTAMTLLGEIRYNALMEGEEMDLAHTVPGVGRFRINVFLCQGDVRAVLRHIPERIPAFEELHLPKVLERLCLERRGMVLVTGITGSGKTTTLAAMLDFMNRTRNDHIVTIEDPVEFVHEDKKCVISQREIGQDSTSFAQALRAALRQDPDIILVGEMRDAEVREVESRVPVTADMQPDDLECLGERVEFLERTQLDRWYPEVVIKPTVLGGYDRLLEHIAVHRYFMGIDEGRPISEEEAVRHWYETLYVPVVEVVTRSGILEELPGRTATDIYLWTMDHLHFLRSQEGGAEAGPGKAAQDLIESLRED